MRSWSGPVKLLFSSPLPVEDQVFVADHITEASVVIATPLVSLASCLTSPIMPNALFQFADGTAPVTSEGANGAGTGPDGGQTQQGSEGSVGGGQTRQQQSTNCALRVSEF